MFIIVCFWKTENGIGFVVDIKMGEEEKWGICLFRT